jgi:hypothetical protein
LLLNHFNGHKRKFRLQRLQHTNQDQSGGFTSDPFYVFINVPNRPTSRQLAQAMRSLMDI